MSSDPESQSTPSHWEIKHDGDPVPLELLEPPRYRCSEDGTRVYSLDDVAAHDEQFHPEVLHAGAGSPSVDTGMLRREALDQAARVATGRESQQQLIQRAQAFEAFLRGDPLAAVQDVVRAGLADDAPDQVHDALDRAWKAIEESADGETLTMPEADDEEVLELLRQLGDGDLRRVVFVLQIVRVLATGARLDAHS